MQKKAAQFWKTEKMDQAEPSGFWLEKVRLRHEITSDAKLAIKLKMSKSAVSQLMTGKTKMGMKTAIQIASLLEMDPVLIYSSVHSLVESPEQEFWIETFNAKNSEKL